MLELLVGVQGERLSGSSWLEISGDCGTEIEPSSISRKGSADEEFVGSKDL